MREAMAQKLTITMARIIRGRSFIVRWRRNPRVEVVHF
jgi:hypothetical protein